MRRLSSIGLLCWLSCGPVPAPQAVPAPPPAPPAKPAPPATVDRTIHIEYLDGPVPWTHLHPADDEDTFQFAIVTDRTGGVRKGIFADAVSKLNLLQPELVMSVGDLIEGYHEDRSRLTAEWDEFDDLVRGLHAPFFYVPGNHDLTNDVMRDVWRERYGRMHYAFVYKNVLFVCLNTMDGDMHQVSPEQHRWLGSVLQQHPDVSWTLLFLHTPLWDQSKGQPQEASKDDAWTPIAAALGDRKYTAFAGHHHRYVKHEHRSRKHFTLATTGGASALRGPAYGEFDHVVWVTMTEDGPVIANLMLDGIWDEDVRTSELRDFQNSLLSDEALKPSVIYYQKRFSRGQSTVRVKNDRNLPIEVTLTAPHDHGYQITPATLTLRVEPNSVSDQQLEVQSNLKQMASALTLPMSWSARSLGEDGSKFAISGSSPLSLVQLGKVSRAHRPVKLDGALNDWGRLPMFVEKPSQVLRNARAHRGAQDNHFRVGLSANAEQVYIAVEVVDDEVMAKPDVVPWEQDGIEIRVDARPDPLRAHSHGAHDGQRFITIAMSPSPSPDQDWFAPRHLKKPEAVEGSCVRSKTGFVTEVAIQRSALDKAAGGKATRIRVNVAVNDRDQDGQSQSWWWPDWRTADDIPGSGTFELAP